MFKKLKNTIIIFIISIYCIGMLVSCCGSFLQHYQMVRHANKVHQLLNPTLLAFTEKEWQNFKNDNEIFYKNDYYDVISFKKDSNKIIVKAVKDSTENHLRVVVNQVFKKNKKPFSENKTNLNFSKHLVAQNQYCLNKNTIVLLKINHSFDLYSFQKTKNYIFIIENPPC